MFDSLNIDAITGAEIMNLLNIPPYLLNDPIAFNRIADVVSYLKDVPDKTFFVNRITTGKPVDKLNHVWSYIQVLKKKSEIEGQLSSVDKNISSFSDKLISGQLSEIERSLASDAVRTKEELTGRLSQTREEQFAYEK